jgi:tRNA nucleotidyltransferase (CCA-adding enzyme)
MNKIKEVLKEIDFSISPEKIEELKMETKELVGEIKNEIKKQREKAEVFIGGSFAKGTLIRENEYDVDIFVRFDKEDDLSNKLEKIIKKVSGKIKRRYERVHGSRDYFRIIKDKETRYEIIPVLKVKKAKEARNVTDLSYFHVNYVRKKINPNIAKEIGIAKAFFKSAGVYGAESYIRGISGYGVECLLIYYKKFENLVNAIAKSKEGEKIIIDIEKDYKNKQELLIDINESKSHGPMILVDPTWKGRNVLAALGKETFDKLKERVNKFLANPSRSYFEIKEIDVDKLRKYAKDNKSEFVDIVLTTDRQEGDIAGTKMKKFSLYLESEIGKYFQIKKEEFAYNDAQEAKLYLIVKPNKEFTKIGPPVKMKSSVSAFKSQNKKVYEKAGRLYAKITINFSCKSFINDFKEKYKDKIKEMDVTGISVS